MRRPRVAAEEGWAVVIAIFSMTVILSVGIGMLAYVDGSSRRSGTERVDEVAFNVGEAALNNEVLLLAARWPSTSTAAYPSSCGRTSTSINCPSAPTLASAFTGTDFDTATTWTVTVRDNLGTAATYYDRAVLDATACGTQVPCTWDSNRDGTMWVRAQATVKDRTRTVVALAKQQRLRLAFPRNTITAGKFASTNDGKKTIIDEKGCSAKTKPNGTCNATQPAPVVVRCTSATAGTTGDACLGYRSEQIAPSLTTQGFVGNVLDTTSLNQMRTYAVELGTYYTSCPSLAQLEGRMVFIEGVSCTYGGGGANNKASPGILVVNKGTLTFNSGFSYYGLIYAANNLTPPADAGWIVTLNANAYVQGSVVVEGQGGLRVGSTGLNISFDEGVLNNILASGGSAAIAQNSFRELRRGQ